MYKIIAMVLFTLSASALAETLPNWGYIRPQNWKRLAKWNDMSGVLAKESMPSAFNWNDYATLQPVRNQKACGSCWAFSTTAVVESLHMIMHGPKLHDIDLAEQTLVSSCSSAGSCGGGFFTAFNYIRDVGLPDEAQDAYLARNSRCKSGLVPEQKIKEWHYVGRESGRGPTTEQIKAAIFQYGPVSVDVNGFFGRYSGGVYTSCGSTAPNHMVTIEGWIDDGQYSDYGGGYWIMRNSWGESWGENGYMKIVYKSKRGSRCNGIGGITAYAVLPEMPEGFR
jgi:C1A family cysteine protease